MRLQRGTAHAVDARSATAIEVCTMLLAEEYWYTVRWKRIERVIEMMPRDA